MKERFDPDHVKSSDPGYHLQRRSRESILTGRGSTWTAEQLDAIEAFYAAHDGTPMRLAPFAESINRTRHQVCRVARWLGLAQRDRAQPMDVRRRTGKRMSEVWAERGHPRGATGMKHSEESRRKISERILALSALGMLQCQRIPKTQEELHRMSVAMSKRMRTTNVYSRAKRGYRDDLGDTFFRSSWEANYARFLNLLVKQGAIMSWDFEPDTFWFDGVKRGTRSYLPDFRVTRPDGSVYYVEVKGWMDAKSKTKLKRMKKYHPTIELVVVDAKAYREIERKLSGAIPQWERAA